MKVLNFFVIKYFKNTIANVGSLQLDIQYIKVVVARTEVECIFTSLRHQRQVAHDNALKKRKRECNKSSDDKVVRFSKTNDQRIEGDNENASNINLQKQKMIQQLKATKKKKKKKKTGKIMQKFIEVKKIDMKCKEKYKNCSTNQNKASIEIF